MKRRAKLAAGGLAGLLIATTLVVVTHDVPTDLTPVDKHYVAAILEQAGYDPASLSKSASQDFEAEVRAVVAVQDAVLKAAPKHKAIPLGQEREPKNLFELKYGHCYDRSRAIEKVLAFLGYDARHVAIYSTKKTPWFWVKGPAESHAVTEVKTSKGWMAVDSNLRWIGLDRSRDAISLEEVQNGPHEWAPESHDAIHAIFTAPFVHIRGLYSRHGRFFPPFTPVPDFNVAELLENFSE